MAEFRPLKSSQNRQNFKSLAVGHLQSLAVQQHFPLLLEQGRVVVFWWSASHDRLDEKATKQPSDSNFCEARCPWMWGLRVSLSQFYDGMPLKMIDCGSMRN